MKGSLPAFLFCGLTQIGVLALEPSKVDGVVDVQLDRSKPVWVVKVVNHSKEELRYEMVGKVPRGLALELWDVMGDDHLPKINAVRIHAEDLARKNMDVFPADIRSVAPGGSAIFPLDPKSMSTTDDLALAKWERAKRIGYYECRVVFGMYASRMIEVEPLPQEKKEADEKQEHAVAEKLQDLKDGEPFGLEVRRMLKMEGLVLVDFHSTSNGKKELELTLLTCRKDDFLNLQPLDPKKPVQIPMHLLIAQAEEIARKKDPECVFEGFMVNPCEDDPAKFYVSFSFSSNRDYIDVNLLMNGKPTKTIAFAVTEQQHHELREFRVPVIQDKDGANAPKDADK